MPPSSQIDNTSEQPTPTPRHFPLSVVLPLGQLLLCAALLVIFCGPESLAPVRTGTGTIYVETQSTVTHRSADGPQRTSTSTCSSHRMATLPLQAASWFLYGFSTCPAAFLR